MFAEKIEHVLLKRKMSKSELAAALNVSSQNLYNKLKKDDFKESDMEKIADVLGCKLDVTLELNDTGDKF